MEAYIDKAAAKVMIDSGHILEILRPLNEQALIIGAEVGTE